MCSRDRLFCEGVKRAPLISGVVAGTRATHARRLFSRGIFSHRAVESTLSLPLARRAGRGGAVWRWGDLSLKGRFFQAANPVDCVHKDPPSLEFPVRRGGEELVSKTKTRGSARERGWRERGEARGWVGDSPWGREVAVVPEGRRKSEREIRR